MSFWRIDELTPWLGKKPKGGEGQGGGGGPAPDGKWDEEDEEQQGQDSSGQGEGKDRGKNKQPGAPGKDNKDQGDGDKGEGEGQGGGDFKHDKDAGEKSGPGTGDVWDEIEDRHREVESNMAKDKQVDDVNELGRKKASGTEKMKKSGSPGKDRGAIVEVDWKSITPTFNWKTILKELITSTAKKVEETRRKPPRRVATGISVGAQVGSYALPASEVPLDEDEFKLLLILDSSGSMMEPMPIIFAEMDRLLKSANKQMSNLRLIRFSDTHAIYDINFKKKSTARISTHGEKPTKWEHNLENLMTTSTSGGTVFTEKIFEETAAMVKDGYNVILFTDDDIVSGDNGAVFRKMYNTFKREFWSIFADQGSYARACEFLKTKPKNFTHFA